MGSCADCKHWDRDGAVQEAVNNEADVCFETKHRICLRIVHGNDTSCFIWEHRNETAMVIDGESYIGQFWTMPEFGCSLFEPVEAKEEK